MTDEFQTASRPYNGGAFFSIEETVTWSNADQRQFVRHVVRHPGGAAIVALVGQAAVCVKQYRPAIERLTIELPAGRPEGQEPSVETAMRELREETGLLATQLVPLTQFYNAPCFCDGLTELFVATEFEEGSAEFGADFPTHVTLVELGRVEELVTDGLLVDAKTIIGLMIARSWLNHRSGS